jgi:hydroxymethylbilane synthase
MALRLGTRGSRLALWQANAVADRLAACQGAVEIVTIRTAGDRLQDRPLSEAGTKSLFVKELEDALLNGTIDCAVHSAKDMPAELPPGLAVVATLPREDPRDAVVLPAGAPADLDLTQLISRLGTSPAIATSSVRRALQLARLVPGARFVPIRGNVDTRIRKLDEGGYDALVLAAAGLRRLGVASRISALLPIDACVPAPGQGIVAVEARADDGATHAAMADIHDRDAATALAGERALVAALGGGCQLPLGGILLRESGELEMRAVVLAPDGTTVIRAQARGPLGDPEGLGRRVAADLEAAGARDILNEARRQS